MAWASRRDDQSVDQSNHHNDPATRHERQKEMTSSTNSEKLLSRDRSNNDPTNMAWASRYDDNLLPPGDLPEQTRSRGQKPRYKTTAAGSTADKGQIPREESQDVIKGSGDEGSPKDPEQQTDHTDDQHRHFTVEEKEGPFSSHREESKSEETEQTTSSDSIDTHFPLKRQPSCDSLFTGKHLKPGAVWTPYGPPLYGYGNTLHVNQPRRKAPDTLVILAAIFYTLAAVSAVVFAVFFQTNVVSVYMTPKPVPVWMQQFSPEMQRWYQLALSSGRNESEIQPPGTVQQPTEEPPIHVQQYCENALLSELHHGYFNCTDIAYYNTYVRMCIAKCHVGYRTNDAGLLFCNRGRWAPIEPEVVSTLVGVGRAADAMPNTDPRVFQYLGIPDKIYADVALKVLEKIAQVPNFAMVRTYLNLVSVENIIDFDMMRQMLIWVGPYVDHLVANLDFLEVLSDLETFGASRRPVCTILDCGGDFETEGRGRVNSTATTYLSEARVVCERGYLPRNPVLTCNATGQWDKPSQCDPVNCSIPADPPHGSYLCQGHVFSDSCDVICDVGYLPETDAILGCSWTGNWTVILRGKTTEIQNALSADGIVPQSLTCVIADCGDLLVLPYGDVTCTGTTYGETCHLTCHDGYERLNNDNFTCQVDRDTAQATWDGNPECTPVSCGAPPEFPNTVIQCASGHTYGNTCGVTCDAGYEGTNHQSIVCHSTGVWSLQVAAPQPVVGGPDLFCQKIDCGNLTTPANGSLTCNGTRYQDFCNLSCEPGYIVGDESGHLLHDVYKFKCLASGQWNSKPICVQSDYCQLGLHDCHPQHGECIKKGHQTFECRCRVGTVGNGTHCDRILCPDFPVAQPENGFFHCPISGSSADDASQSANSTMGYEAVCFLQCNPGYDRLIYVEYSCREDGNWTIPLDIHSAGIKPCLAVKCPDLSSPVHGNITCDSSASFRYPETCNFACDRGYELTLTNSSERHCQTDATWSGNDALCIGVQCPDLSRPTNGRMACDAGRSFRHPENCTFSCDSGYELTPTSSRDRHCQADSNWSGNDAECIGVQCRTLSSPLNGGMTCDHGYTFHHPDSCRFSCDHGYVLTPTSSRVRSCQADSSWSGNDPMCIGVQCPALSTPSNGRMSCNNGFSFRHPETCAFSCNHGYLMSAGTSSRICEADGTSTGRSVACSVFAVGTVCNSRRDLFFVLDGSGSVGPTNFPDVKRFALNVVSAFTIGSTDTRVGVVQYSSSNTMEFNLGDHTTAFSTLNAINAITYQDGGTQTGAALDYVRRNAAWRSTSVPKIAIVVTDGQSGDDVVAPSQALARDRVTVFAIGVGNFDQYHSQLVEIANNNPGHVFELADFIGLVQDINQIVNAICNA